MRYRSCLVLLVAAAPACVSARSAPPPPPVLVGSIPCADTLTLELIEQPGVAAPERVYGRVRIDAREDASFTAFPARVVVNWDADVYRGGDAPPRPQARSTVVDVYWRGRLTGQEHWHGERVHLSCGGSRTERVALPRELTVRISTDPDSVSVFLLPTDPGSSGFLGTTPLERTLLVSPTSTYGWRYELQKSGFRTDTLVIRRPRENEVFRRVLQPLPHRIPPDR